MKSFFNSFWKWYEKHETLNIGVAAFLFTLQLVHLYWLTTHVVMHRIIGVSYWDPSAFLEGLLLLVDYTEIPALITVSLVYLNTLRKKFDLKSFLYLLFLNSQWLHIFWITDEFVIDTFTGSKTATVLPYWVAWAAILIDYLELPVIYDTLLKFFKALRKEGVSVAIKKLREEK